MSAGRRWETNRVKFCDVCGWRARLVHDIQLYGRPVYEWPFHWWCPNCHAHVVCKMNTDTPRGAMDSLAVKEARRQAHRVFDRLWKTREERTQAYEWLRKEMGLSKKKCHIQLFTISQCQEVIRLVRERIR